LVRALSCADEAGLSTHGGAALVVVLERLAPPTPMLPRADKLESARAAAPLLNV
jgi:hypothetical protein